MTKEISAQGAYKGVPYKVFYSEWHRFDWEMINPREWDPGCALLIFENKQNYDSLLEELPSKYIEVCRGELVDLCLKHKETVAAALKKLVKQGIDIYDGTNYDEDDLRLKERRLEIAENVIYNLCQSPEYSEMSAILELCPVPSRQGEIIIDDHSYQYIYYRTDGKAITGKTKDKFDCLYDEAKNWVQGNCFDVELPGTTYCGHVTAPFNHHDDDHPLAELIKERIDALLALTNGKYKITAARADFDQPSEEISYAPDKNITLYTSNKDEADEMVRFYGGRAVQVITSEAEKAR